MTLRERFVKVIYTPIYTFAQLAAFCSAVAFLVGDGLKSLLAMAGCFIILGIGAVVLDWIYEKGRK